MEKYYLYWYKLKHHKNPKVEGYIGVTNNLNRRILEHARNIKNGKVNHFYNALRKYENKDVEIKVLHTLNTRKDILDLEYYYRPSTNIGWNSAEGGEEPLLSVQKTTISLYHKDSYVLLHTFESIEKAASALGISSSRIRQAIHRKTGYYGYDGWAVLHTTNTDRSQTITIEKARSNALKNIKKDKPSHFKGMTNRWSKEQRKKIGSYHKGKTLSKAQIEATRKKHQASHPSCRSITLYHQCDIHKYYSYHSLSEASRQLGIPLSRLKSKAQRPLNRFGNDGWAIKTLGSE